MTAPAALLKSIQSSSTALMLAGLLAQPPALARRTVQRWMGHRVAQGLVTAGGEGRARRYTAPRQSAPVSANLPTDRFPLHTPRSADSVDTLAYVDQPLQARKPVGYQGDFLEAYQPNVSVYLPDSLRRQLHKMGSTAQAREAAGTYAAGLNRHLLMNLHSALAENLLPIRPTKAAFASMRWTLGKACTGPCQRRRKSTKRWTPGCSS